MKKILIRIIFCLFIVCCNGQKEDISKNNKQDEIIEKYLENGAWNHHYTTNEWNDWIDMGIKKDSTIDTDFLLLEVAYYWGNPLPYLTTLRLFVPIATG